MLKFIGRGAGIVAGTLGAIVGVGIILALGVVGALSVAEWLAPLL